MTLERRKNLEELSKFLMIIFLCLVRYRALVLNWHPDRAAAHRRKRQNCKVGAGSKDNKKVSNDKKEVLLEEISIIEIKDSSSEEDFDALEVNENSVTDMETRMKEINHAYEILSNDESRKSYDKERATALHTVTISDDLYGSMDAPVHSFFQRDDPVFSFFQDFHQPIFSSFHGMTKEGHGRSSRQMHEWMMQDPFGQMHEHMNRMHEFHQQMHQNILHQGFHAFQPPTFFQGGIPDAPLFGDPYNPRNAPNRRHPANNGNASNSSTRSNNSNGGSGPKRIYF